MVDGLRQKCVEAGVRALKQPTLPDDSHNYPFEELLASSVLDAVVACLTEHADEWCIEGFNQTWSPDVDDVKWLLAVLTRGDTE